MLAFAAAMPLAAQVSPPSRQDSNPNTRTLTSTSSLVLVPTLVRDRSGKLVFALKGDDFLLKDDGIPQQLHLEEDAAAEPIALVVLIEAGAATRSAGWHPLTTGSPPDRLESLPTMIDAMTEGVPHSVALVGFDSGPELLQDFTYDMNSVGNAIHDLSTNIDGDGGGAILDSLNFSLDLLRRQPPQYRRAILLLSETDDRGSKIRLEQTLRAVSETNTAVYSLAFSTGKTDAAEYAHRELPTKHIPAPCAKGDDLCTQRQAAAQDQSMSTAAAIIDGITYGIALDNPYPGPAHGCMSTSDPTAHGAKNPAVRAFDCLGQLVPPLAMAKVAAIAASEGMQRNVPETVTRLSGGEYYKLSDAKSLETSLLALSNHIPNRYLLSFQPQSPQPGFHSITLQLPGHVDLSISARNGYWAEAGIGPSADGAR